MGAQTGIQARGIYPASVIGGAGANTALVAATIAGLTALIPDPDVAPAQAGAGRAATGTALDQMHPAAAAQLRVEITALLAAISDA